MQMVPHKLVGFPNPVYLPDDIRVRVNIVPDRFIGWVRSGTPNAVDYSTWHDTGSPGSRARSEEAYLHSGPRANGQIRQVGYTGAVDDIEFVQLTPGDETTWAAGTPDGNRLSHHIEQCYGGDIDFERSFRNAAAVHGGIIASYPGWQLRPSLKKHQDWSGKWCPAQILNAGRWPEAVDLAESFFQAARAAAAGGTTDPDPEPEPDVVDVLSRCFGAVVAQNGLTYRYDPNGPVSTAWRARGDRLGRWPRLVDVWEGDGARHFLFSDGAIISASGRTLRVSDDARG